MRPLKKIKLNKMLVLIGKAADASGVQAYLVGGAVRDLLTGKKDLDLDIAVEGNPEPLVKAAAKLIKGRITTYPQFGTFSVEASNGLKIDFATARKETYVKPGALPKVIFSDIEHDIFRRDFTINSLAMRLKKGKRGEIIDLYGGRRDLRNGVLRVLHENSFKDDPTRIFRLARFSARGFKIDRLTAKLAGSAKKYIKRISPERISNELLLIMNEKDPYTALKILQEFGAADIILPGIEISQRLLNLSKEKGVERRLASLFMEADSSSRRKIYTSLRFSNKLKNSVEKLLEPKQRKPALNGNDLIKMGYRQGPIFKKILESLSLSGIVSRPKARKYVFDKFPQKI